MNLNGNPLLLSIKELILGSRKRVFKMAKNALLQTYWQIGKLINEDGQKGHDKAGYGKATLKNLQLN